jgi:hypothetical protein
MDALLKQEFEVPCPGGGKSTKMKLDRILNSAIIRTSKGHYNLKSNSKSKIRNQLRNMQREQDKFQKQLEKMQKEFFELYGQMYQDAEKVIK